MFRPRSILLTIVSAWLAAAPCLRAYGPPPKLDSREAFRQEIARMERILQTDPGVVRRLLVETLEARGEYYALVKAGKEELADLIKGIEEEDELVKEAKELKKRFASVRKWAKENKLLVPQHIACAVRNDKYTTASGVKVMGVPLEALSFDRGDLALRDTILSVQNEVLDRWEEVEQEYKRKYGQEAIRVFNKKLRKKWVRLEHLRGTYENNQKTLLKLYRSGRYEHCLGSPYRLDTKTKKWGKTDRLPWAELNDELEIQRIAAIGKITFRPAPEPALNFVRDGEFYIETALEIQEDHLSADWGLYLLEVHHMQLKIYDTLRGMAAAVGDPIVKNMGDEKQGWLEGFWNSLAGVGKVLTVDLAKGLVDSCRRLVATPRALQFLDEDFNPEIDGIEAGLTVDEARQLLERHRAWQKVKAEMHKTALDLYLKGKDLKVRWPDRSAHEYTVKGDLAYLKELVEFRKELKERSERLQKLNLVIDGYFDYGMDALNIYLTWSGMKHTAGGSAGLQAWRKGGKAGYLKFQRQRIQGGWKQQVERLKTAKEYVGSKLKAKRTLANDKVVKKSGERPRTPEEQVLEKSRQEAVTKTKEFLEQDKKLAETMQRQYEQSHAAPDAPPVKVDPAKVLDADGKVKGELLGQGGYGEVYRLAEPIEGCRAIKRFKDKCGSLEKGNKVCMQEWEFYQKAAAKEGGLSDLTTKSKLVELPGGELALVKEVIPDGYVLSKADFASLTPKQQALVRQAILKTADRMIKNEWYHCDFAPDNLWVDMAKIKKLADDPRPLSQLMDDVPHAKMVECDNMANLQSGQLTSRELAQRQMYQMVNDSPYMNHMLAGEMYAISDTPHLAGAPAGKFNGPLERFFSGEKGKGALKDWAKKKYGFDPETMMADELITGETPARLGKKYQEAMDQQNAHAEAQQQFAENAQQVSEQARSNLQEQQRAAQERGAREVKPTGDAQQVQVVDMGEGRAFTDSQAIREVIGDEGARISSSEVMKRDLAELADLADEILGPRQSASFSSQGVRAVPVSEFVKKLGQGERITGLFDEVYHKYKRAGGNEAALADYQALGPTNEVPVQGGGRRGQLDSGMKVSYRPDSGNGRPVVEITRGGELLHEIHY